MNNLLIFTELVQTLLPSHKDPSTLPFPTHEALQLTESMCISPPFFVSQELQNKTPGLKKKVSTFHTSVIIIYNDLARYLRHSALDLAQLQDYLALDLALGSWALKHLVSWLQISGC